MCLIIFLKKDYRANNFIYENEEYSCNGPHFTRNNGGVRAKLPFDKVYQPYNGPTIRKFNICIIFFGH